MDISRTISPYSGSGATYPAIGPNSAIGWASPQPGLLELIAVPLNSERRNRHSSGEAKLRVMTISRKPSDRRKGAAKTRAAEIP
jgi:hypothetical protein